MSRNVNPRIYKKLNLKIQPKNRSFIKTYIMNDQLKKKSTKKT